MRRYPLPVILLHWLMALLILAAYLTSEGGRPMRDNPAVLHFLFGLSVLILVVPRLALRLFGHTPPLPATMPPLMVLAAKLGHLALYAMIIALPLTGWYAASRLGVTVTFAGLPVPALTAAVEGSPGWVAELHQLGGNAILILAGLHGLVALWHQFVMRDGLLQRMNPFTPM